MLHPAGGWSRKRLPFFLSKLAAAVSAGKGRGLIATAPLSAGDLLLVVPPVALLEWEEGEPIPGTLTLHTVQCSTVSARYLGTKSHP